MFGAEIGFVGPPRLRNLTFFGYVTGYHVQTYFDNILASDANFFWVRNRLYKQAFGVYQTQHFDPTGMPIIIPKYVKIYHLKVLTNVKKRIDKCSRFTLPMGP